MTRRRPGMAGLDPMTGPLVEDTDDLDRRLRAVIDYITASPRTLPSARLAPPAAPPGEAMAAAASGRPGTSPVTGPAA